MKKFATKEEHDKYQRRRLEAFCDIFQNHPDPVKMARMNKRPPNYIAVSRSQYKTLAALKETVQFFSEYLLIWSPLLINEEILFFWRADPPSHAEIRDCITWRKLADRDGQ